jgi:hypothetical protein
MSSVLLLVILQEPPASVMSLLKPLKRIQPYHIVTSLVQFDTSTNLKAMPVYTSCSISTVIGNVIRRTRVQDTSYILDCNEWIPEAMGYMRTKVEQQSAWIDSMVNFHMCPMPIATIRIDSVIGLKWGGNQWHEHGHRLYENSSGSRPASAPKHFHNHSNAQLGSTNGFLTVPEARETGSGDSSGIIYQSTAIPLVSNMDCHHNFEHQWYKVELDQLLVSFPDGPIRIYYTRLPLDENNIPLIPDNEFYKTALYWHVRRCMVGAGWKDPAYNVEYLDRQFELYAARAINQIRYPSVASMEMKVNALQRLWMPKDYFEKQFEITHSERYYGDEYYDSQPTPYI